MDLGIAGKVALVSGGSRGVGRKAAEMFAEEGCKVAVVARGKEALDETVAAIRASGGEAIGVAGDLTLEADVVRAVTETTEAFGPPDIAVSNVHGPGPASFDDLTDENLAEAFQRMTISLVYMARACLPHMKQQRWGRLVNVGSGAAKEPPAGLRHILANSTRAAAVALNKSMANELGSYGITVNTVATGWIGTERMHEYVRKVAAEKNITPEQVLGRVTADIPAGRVGRPEEEASLVVYLASELGGYINGEFINVDGGSHRSAF
jgi:3-oxoacyl-[acyl-carrier protein] reductase